MENSHDETALEMSHRVHATAEVQLCEWYAMCFNPAVGTVSHPIIGSVPVCQPCRDKHDLTWEK